MHQMERIGRYLVRAELGCGGFAEVYRAWDPDFERPVAIKLLRNPQLLPWFKREAKAIGRLYHPNIVTIYDVSEENRLPFLVMEYVQGKDLKQVIASDSLTLLEKVRLLEQIAQGLHHAHQQGILHRDIKPANIAVTDGGIAKVLDFGIAHIPGESATEVTEIGLVMGSPGYMAPEVVEGKTANELCDIFSFGVLSYELISGTHPCPRSLSPAHGPTPRRLNTLISDCPGRLTKLVHRTIHREPYQRPRSFEEVLCELRKVIQTLQGKEVRMRVNTSEGLLKQGNLVEAAEEITRALRMEPNSRRARDLAKTISIVARYGTPTRSLPNDGNQALATIQFTFDKAIPPGRSEPGVAKTLTLNPEGGQAPSCFEPTKTVKHICKVGLLQGAAFSVLSHHKKRTLLRRNRVESRRHLLLNKCALCRNMQIGPNPCFMGRKTDEHF